MILIIFINESKGMRLQNNLIRETDSGESVDSSAQNEQK